MSFATSLHVVTPRGKDPRIGPQVHEALQAADGVQGLRALLVAAKVDLDAEPAPEAFVESRPAVTAVITCFPDLVEHGRSGRPRAVLHDAVLTGEQLILVRAPKTPWFKLVQSGMADGYGLGRAGFRDKRLARLRVHLSLPREQLLARPDVRAIAWDDVTSAKLVNALNYRWTLSLVCGGDTLKLRAIETREGPTSEDLAPLLRQLLGDRLQGKASP